MASVSRDRNGTKRVLFTDRDGERKAVRLGAVSAKTAEAFRLKLQDLIAARFTETAIDAETARWLADLPDRMYARLVRVGLAEPRASASRVTLGGLLAAFFASVDVKPATLVRMKQVEAALVGCFTKERDAATIGETDADGWRTWLKEQGYAAATVSRSVIYARQVFKWAMRRGMVASNPFAFVKAGSQSNPARAAFIDRDTIAKVIDAAPDAEWRLLIALSRFGGLRVPSEALALRWSDVNWEHNRLTVRSPKTEHHEGKGERIIPLFPEIREHLQAVFDAAPVGSVNVIGRYRVGANLNPHFRRIIRRAGVAPWPRTWHNLRASRQTELAATFPLHTVCAWIGNSKAVAAGHYLQVTDADWVRAIGGAERGAQSGANCGAPEAQIAAQHPFASCCADSHERTKTPRNTEGSHTDANERESVRTFQVGRTGLEPVTSCVSCRRASQLRQRPETSTDEDTREQRRQQAARRTTAVNRRLTRRRRASSSSWAIRA